MTKDRNLIRTCIDIAVVGFWHPFSFVIEVSLMLIPKHSYNLQIHACM